MLIDVNLGHNKEVTLTYELYDNAVTRLYYDRISNQPNEVVSRNEFYNFGESQQDITQELNGIIDDLRHLVPDLIGDDNVENLNQLHINFPDNEKKYANNPKVFALLRDFNNRIHHLERLQKQTNNTSMLFTVDNDPGIDLPEEAYSMFTPNKQFGEMYMNYPHVGKHFMELFYDQDTDIPQEQIILTHKMASGLYCWFGNDMQVSKRMQMNMFKFFCSIQNKIPYEWGDPKLAIGYLPLGKVTHEIDLNAVSQNRYLHSWVCR